MKSRRIVRWFVVGLLASLPHASCFLPLGSSPSSSTSCGDKGQNRSRFSRTFAPTDPRRRAQSHVAFHLLRRMMATSSSDLKNNDRKNKKRDIITVAARLSKASKEAAAARVNPPPERFPKPPGIKSSSHYQESEGDNLKSITDLSRSIDEELLRPRDGYRPPRETSSIKMILEHNDKSPGDKHEMQKDEFRNVAVVFSKPLWNDQITTEYASRLTLLAQMIKEDDYRPSLICFCGSNKPIKDNVISETSAGVVFFRHLCASNDILLDNMDLCIICHENERDTSWSSVTSLHPIAEELHRRHYLESWLETSDVYEAATDEYGMRREEPRKKIRIQFTLISTDYHLCNLNDIHHRSPRQSPLKTMLQELEHSIRGFRGLAEITWRFRYTPYPYVDSKDDLTVFLGNCYKLSQQLRPLFINIRGVANQDEFFQRDNYRVLVATRRSLVTLLEEMNEAFRHSKQRKTSTGLVGPGLKGKLRTTFAKGYREISSEFGKRTISGYVSTDVALESALLALGRCADLVRPAGRLTSRSVSQEEWTDAIQQLEHFLDLMETACDPDRPLPADQWGLLSLPRSVSTYSLPVDAADPASGMERDAMLDLADLFGADIGMDDSLE